MKGGCIMMKFAVGMMTGVAVGAGIILSVNPRSRREMKKVCRKMGKMMKNCSISRMSC